MLKVHAQVSCSRFRSKIQSQCSNSKLPKSRIVFRRKLSLMNAWKPFLLSEKIRLMKQITSTMIQIFRDCQLLEQFYSSFCIKKLLPRCSLVGKRFFMSASYLRKFEKFWFCFSKYRENNLIYISIKSVYISGSFEMPVLVLSEN